MRALRRRKREPGLAAERRNLVHRYMGNETPAPPPAAEELPADEAVEEVSLPLTAATDVIANDAGPPPVSSSEPRADVEAGAPRLVAPDPPAPPTAAADPLETLWRKPGTPPAVAPEPPAPPIAATDSLETLRREAGTSPAVAPEPPAPPVAVTDPLETLQPEVGTPPAVAPEPPAPPIAVTDPLETLQPSTFDAALRTLEEVGRLCEPLVRLGDERGRWALLAEKKRQLVPPPGSPGA